MLPTNVVDSMNTRENAIDRATPERLFKDRILIKHHPVIQTIGDTSIVVEQLSTIPFIKKSYGATSESASAAGRTSIQLNKIFAPGTIIIPFGMPDMYTMDYSFGKVVVPAEEGSPEDCFKPYDMPPAGYAVDSTVFPFKIDRGADPSPGEAKFYIILNLKPEDIQAIDEAYERNLHLFKYPSSPSVVASRIMHKAGFYPTKRWCVPLEKGDSLLHSIFKSGLSRNGRSVEYMVVANCSDELSETISPWWCTYEATGVKACFRTPVKGIISDVSHAEANPKPVVDSLQERYYIVKDGQSFTSSSRINSVEVLRPVQLRKTRLRAAQSSKACIYRITIPHDIREGLPLTNVQDYPLDDDDQNVLKRLESEQKQDEAEHVHELRPGRTGNFLKLTATGLQDVMPWFDQSYQFVLTNDTLTIMLLQEGSEAVIAPEFSGNDGKSLVSRHTHILLAHASGSPGQVVEAGLLSWQAGGGSSSENEWYGSVNSMDALIMDKDMQLSQREDMAILNVLKRLFPDSQGAAVETRCMKIARL